MVVVNPRVESGVSRELLDRLAQVSPATIGHRLEHEFMDPELRPIITRFKFCGPAVTLRVFGTDSAIVHYAMDVVRPGDVMIIDRLGDRRYACWGGGVTTAAVASGVAGAVVDGVLTDRVEIEDMRFPVFGRGLSPITTRAPGLTGELNVSVRCGGVIVNPGDIILADDDGVIVLAPNRVEEIIETFLAIELRGRERQQQMREGASIAELSGSRARIEATLRSQNP